MVEGASSPLPYPAGHCPRPRHAGARMGDVCRALGLAARRRSVRGRRGRRCGRGSSASRAGRPGIGPARGWNRPAALGPGVRSPRDRDAAHRRGCGRRLGRRVRRDRAASGRGAGRRGGGVAAAGGGRRSRRRQCALRCAAPLGGSLRKRRHRSSLAGCGRPGRSARRSPANAAACRGAERPSGGRDAAPCARRRSRCQARAGSYAAAPGRDGATA